MKINNTEILDKLAYTRDNGKSKQERQRAHALLLTNDGISKAKIANILGVSIRSVFSWLKAYKDDGISSLKCKKGRGRKLLLHSKEHKKIVEKNIALFAHQPKKAYAMTVDETGIKLSYDTFKYF